MRGTPSPAVRPCQRLIDSEHLHREQTVDRFLAGVLRWKDFGQMVIEALLSRRRQVMGMKVAEENRLQCVDGE